MSVIHSYPKIHALGHRINNELYFGPVIVQEKIDGSQFSFTVDVEGELHCRSKGVTLDINNPEKLFKEAVEYLKTIILKIPSQYIFRCEFLKNPKHNTLGYSRIPRNHLMVFDVQNAFGAFSPQEAVEAYAAAVGLEAVPYFQVTDHTEETYKKLLEKESILGGVKIEGLVIKNYRRVFPQTGDILMGKCVSEEFKESHRKEWKITNPTPKDILEKLIEDYATWPRWRKAVQNLRDRGELENSPRDIEKIMKVIPEDILTEEEDEIKQRLFDWAWPHIKRGVTKGFPEWYKELLTNTQEKGTHGE